MKAGIVLLLIAVSFITIKAQDSVKTKFRKEASIELLYSVTPPSTNLGVKIHTGDKWGGYLHARIDFRFPNQIIYSPGRQYIKPLNSYTSLLASLGVSYRMIHFIKPYIGFGAASHSKSVLEVKQNSSVPSGGDMGLYWGGETGILLFLYDRVVLDVGFCYVIEPSVNLGFGISF